MIAYLDTNAVEDLCRLRSGVKAEQREAVVEAVRSGRLIVPASQFVAEELLSADPAIAREVGLFYFDLLSFRHCLREPYDVLQDTMSAIARRSARPSPYEALTQDQLAQWRQLADLSEVVGVASIVRRATERIEAYREVMTLDLPERLESAAQFTMEHLWRAYGARFASTLAKRFGVHQALRGRYHEVLTDRVVRAGVGGLLGVLQAQIVSRRKIDHGDSRDLQHLVLAAATRGPLVTGDGRLRKLVVKIPLDLELLSVPELVNRLGGSPPASP